MENEESYNFRSFVEANAEKEVSGVDYVRAIYKSYDLPYDFIFHFSRLFYPRFKVVDDLVFVADLFDEDYYKSLLDNGQSNSEAQYWANMLEITGLFDKFTFDEALHIAEPLAAIWNAKLNSEHAEHSGRARAIFDKDSGEVFVTIGSVD